MESRGEGGLLRDYVQVRERWARGSEHCQECQDSVLCTDWCSAVTDNDCTDVDE